MEIASFVLTLVGFGLAVWEHWQRIREKRGHAALIEQLRLDNDALRAEVSALQQEKFSVVLEHNRQLNRYCEFFIEQQGGR